MAERELQSNKAKYVLPHPVRLKAPFDLGTKTYSEVVFKNELTAEHIGKLPVGGEQKFEDFYTPIASMLGEPTEVVRHLRPADLMKCIEVFTYFFTGGLETGESVTE